MHEWNVHRGARQSSLSERPFAEGQKVRSLLCRDGSGQLVRRDLHPDEDMGAEGETVIAQWWRTYHSRAEERERARAAVQSAEDLFLDLAAREETTGDPEEAAAHNLRELHYFLALHLERKRVLRPRETPAGEGRASWLHRRSGQVFSLPVATPPPDRQAELSRELAGWIGLE